MKSSENFSARLTALMAERTLTQTELAARMQTRQSTVSQWVSGTSSPRAKTLRDLAAFFKVSSIWLSAGTGEREISPQMNQEKTEPQEPAATASSREEEDDDLLMFELFKHRGRAWSLETIGRWLTQAQNKERNIEKKLNLIKMVVTWLSETEPKPESET